jgi:hypothetical protein
VSHITNIKLSMKDLEAVREAGAACGLELHEGVKSYKNYYGTKPCDHVLRQPGAKKDAWEVGILAQPDGTFTPQLDVWGPQGQALTALVGQAGNKLKREYAAAVATKKARQTLKGWDVVRQDLAGGRIQLRVRRR